MDAWKGDVYVARMGSVASLRQAGHSHSLWDDEHWLLDSATVDLYF